MGCPTTFLLSGHPGEYYPDMPPDPVMYPAEDEEGSIGDESQSSQ